MEKIFLSVLNMSLTASFVIAVIIFVRLPLKKAPKIISYALWAVAGFRFVFPFSFESVFSLLPFKAALIPQDIAMQAVPRIDSGITIIDNAVSASLPAATPDASVNPLQVGLFIYSSIWLLGIAVMLIYSFVSIILLKRKLRGATLIKGNLYEANNLKTPFVIGFIRPKIYIPAGLTDEERRYIVLHEQTHIKRRDHVVKIFAYLVLCLHWFNPLAWAAFVLMGADMEMSCDERVVKELGGDIKNAYSLSLVRVAAGRRILNGSPLAFGEGGMKERIKNVLNFKKPSLVIIVVAVALVAVLSVGFALNRTTDGSILDVVIPMSMNNVHKEPHFAGTVTEVYDSSILVRVNEGEDARRSSDLIDASLNVKLKDSATRFTVGDKVIVYYNGEIAESYPAQINTVYAIVLTSPDMRINLNDIYALAAMRTPYVGDNSAVGKIIGELPRIDREHTQRFFSIGDDYGTGRAPLTLTVYYEPNDAETSDIRNITVTPKNSALLFALIDNLGEVNYAFRAAPSDAELDKAAYTSSVTYSKEDITEYLGSIGLIWEDFQTDWNGSVEKMYASIETTPPHNTELQSVGTTYSPGGKYLIEGYGVDYHSQVSGLTPVEQFRIVEADSGKTVWSKDGLFLFNSLPPFGWSSDGRYVYAAYAGRTWMDGLIVDTTDMSEQPLPGITELAPLFPDTTPDDNRPDPYIVPLSWWEHTLTATFSWRVNEDVGNEENRIYGEYLFDADIGEFTLRDDLGEHYPKANETMLPDGYISEISQRVEDGLGIIMSSPLSSSNPQDYINEHQEEYENLTMKYPEGVLEYLLSQFEAGNSGGLRGHIMMRMCKDMLGLQNNVTDESLYPKEWFKQLSIISEIKLPDFKPKNPEDEYGELIYSAISQQYSWPDNGFVVAAPTVYGEYEEEGKLKIFVTVFYERYKLYGNTLESMGGGVIPGAIIFQNDNQSGKWMFEEYLEVGSVSLPDGMYYNDSIQKLCVMPVSGKEIKGLAEEMNSDYTNDARQELLMKNLKEHLTVYGQTGVSLKNPDGSMVKLT